MKTKLVIDQARLLGFKVLDVKVTADSMDKHSIVGAKIGKELGKVPVNMSAKIGKRGNVPIIVGAKIGKVGKVH